MPPPPCASVRSVTAPPSSSSASHVIASTEPSAEEVRHSTQLRSELELLLNLALPFLEHFECLKGT